MVGLSRRAGTARVPLPRRACPTLHLRARRIGRLWSTGLLLVSLRHLGVTAGSVTAGNVTAGNVTAGNVTAGNVTAGNVTAGNVTAGSVTAIGHFRVRIVFRLF